MLAREALQMKPNARAIIRNPLAIPKCEFYDAFRSAQSCFLLFKCLVNAETVHMDSDAKPDLALVRFRDFTAIKALSLMHFALPLLLSLRRVRDNGGSACPVRR